MDSPRHYRACVCVCVCARTHVDFRVLHTWHSECHTLEQNLNSGGLGKQVKQSYTHTYSHTKVKGSIQTLVHFLSCDVMSRMLLSLPQRITEEMVWSIFVFHLNEFFSNMFYMYIYTQKCLGMKGPPTAVICLLLLLFLLLFFFLFVLVVACHECMCGWRTHPFQTVPNNPHPCHSSLNLRDWIQSAL